MESSPPSQKLSQKLSHKLSPLQSESNTEKYSNEVPDKVVVRLKATGSAPILKQTVFKISSSSKFQNVIAFLRKELAYKQGTMFVYVNSSFAPSPDEGIDNLYRCFAIDGKLIVNYSITPAWG